MKNTAIFLADNGPAVGLGHIRRLLVLASEFARREIECQFLLTDLCDQGVIEQAGFAVAPWLGDLEALPHAGMVAIDGYRFDPSLPARWRQQFGSVVLVVDDLGEKPIAADIVLNHNLYGAEVDYRDYEVRKVLAGPQYALIDRNFVALAERPRADSCSVLISFGGTDDGRYGAAAAQAVLERHPEVIVNVVFLPAAGRSERGTDLTGQFPGRCRVHHGANMVERMASARLYLGASGVTLMEALAAGLDVVACGIADNQRFNIRTLKKLGIPAFDTFDPAAMADATVSRLDTLEPNRLRLIDGAGANRVADEMLVAVSSAGRTAAPYGQR